MKISELWLREWVDPALTGIELSAQLTMAGLEVDDLYPVAGAFDRVVVAQVLATKPHPEATRLTLCEVDSGQGVSLNVVCGAANVRAGLRVALALPGANLPGDIKIKESMLRGQLSQGMLCSGTELGMDDDADGIMELADDAPIGADLRDYLALNDQVLDINLTPNRADCFSVFGVARDVAALNNLPLSAPPSVVCPVVLDEKAAISVKASDACPKYCGRIIRAINPEAKTPVWMKERLRRAGIRSLHPVVDVTNYVMLELGQPMHAFDLKAIDGEVIVRFSNKEEALVLLDGQKALLDEQVLVIADNQKILAIAGVMGGQDSAVQDETTDLFLESAFFTPLVVAGVARRYGLSSESSQRFERGVDPTLPTVALERATELLHAIVGGQIGPIVEVVAPSALPVKKDVLFHPNKVKRLTGVSIAEDNMKMILNNLGMTVDVQKNEWLVGVPPHRFDLSLDVDLVEEIIRIQGYDTIQAEPVTGRVRSGITHPNEDLTHRASEFLRDRGYHETISYSFVDPVLQQELYPETTPMTLVNPISPELSVMRVGMWPGLLASMVYNANRQQTVIKLFEAGVVFDGEGEHLKERACLSGLLAGEYGGLSWNEETRVFDFYDMKGDLEALFLNFDCREVRFIPSHHSALHPGQTARIMDGEDEIGWMGVLHPRIAELLELSHDVLLFELSLASLTHKKSPRYQKISKYPQIRRDLSLLVNNDITFQQISQVVREVVGVDWLKALDVFDLYKGEGVPVGKKSIAIALTLQDDSRTLVDAEINTIITAIVNKLCDEFDITLRTVVS
jgi:phenylalanyl-tRNA synthetase beta chain